MIAWTLELGVTKGIITWKLELGVTKGMISLTLEIGVTKVTYNWCSSYDVY